MNEDLTLKALPIYIDGKIKRYNLMFAVNGGVFALAKIISGNPEPHPLGHLTLIHLSIGAIAFTFIVWFDIWLWGSMMRSHFLKDANSFSWVGKAILSSLASLLVIGWLLAVCSWYTALRWYALLVAFGAAILCLHYWYSKPKAHNDTDGTKNISSTPNA